ncbi:hypothetical protein MLD38_026064 [Melastoma candidum]|uniref:Uncharacterized protein n=1 Tax=Melastoma candidum TaxID=119954 RepID=A0ACB9P449_9MYRT|nr:hypothetical protein MLD38_026064 [Melastoma candidum]
METPPEERRAPPAYDEEETSVAVATVLIVVLVAASSLLLLHVDYSREDGVARPLHFLVSGGVAGIRTHPYSPHRKLLHPPGSEVVNKPSRIPGEGCVRGDIIVIQGASSPLPNGIPAYTVEIINMCPSGCDISAIHLSCGWFSSAHLVNPRVFRRLRYDDCLVNDGKPLRTRETLSFLYASTYSYPLSVASVSCS